ncbi:uncharacterized protein K452DRAFT_21122 [Aplosporella prunicola CBS 121167]|uniref:Uncharacterized protein n=1 Tax=Aplosporella prunicola CBS 121167 TaxID=1176127 RepID=A0A6A6BEU1_9PEZI|nr:uncharacterized protein K452DRAFT_21122 [Aplosporella prunicola CBS 121167]KAF2142586.1 hypothetical protein K452DRAFT_21122 [Aplosporella prunicola CBS 121167]
MPAYDAELFIHTLSPPCLLPCFLACSQSNTIRSQHPALALHLISSHCDMRLCLYTTLPGFIPSFKPSPHASTPITSFVSFAFCPSFPFSPLPVFKLRNSCHKAVRLFARVHACMRACVHVADHVGEACLAGQARPDAVHAHRFVTANVPR